MLLRRKMRCHRTRTRRRQCPRRSCSPAEAAKRAAIVLPWLLGQGYEILNVDLQPFANPDIFSLSGDVTDSGQVSNAMTMHFGSYQWLV